eukprot:898895-Pelagomonas_calceolata.AAC.2
MQTVQHQPQRRDLQPVAFTNANTQECANSKGIPVPCSHASPSLIYMQTPLPLMRKKEKGHPENLAHTHTQTHTQRAHGQKKSAPQAQQVLQGKYSRRVHAASACLESAAWKCLILEVSNSQELILTKFMPRYDLHHAGLVPQESTGVLTQRQWLHKLAKQKLRPTSAGALDPDRP